MQAKILFKGKGNSSDFRPLIEVNFDGVKSKFKKLKRWKNQQVNEGSIITVTNYPAIAKRIYISLFDVRIASRSKKSLAHCAIELSSFKKGRNSVDLSAPIETSFGPQLVNLYAYTHHKSDLVKTEPYIFMGRVAVEIILNVSSDLKQEKDKTKTFPIAPLSKSIATAATFRCVFVLQGFNLISGDVSDEYLRLNLSWANSMASTLPLHLQRDHIR